MAGGNPGHHGAKNPAKRKMRHTFRSLQSTFQSNVRKSTQLGFRTAVTKLLKKLVHGFYRRMLPTIDWSAFHISG
jgi:hypothetical protein